MRFFVSIGDRDMDNFDEPFEIRILSEKARLEKVVFKDNYLDCSSYEKSIMNNDIVFSYEQKTYNSAELINLELRKKYKSYISYKTCELDKAYPTYDFKLELYNKIIATCKYLLNILDLLEVINDALRTNYFEVQSISKKKNKTKEEVEFLKAKASVGAMLSLLPEIKCRMFNLEHSECNIDVHKCYSELLDQVRLKVQYSCFPSDFLKMIETIFGNMSVQRLPAKMNGETKLYYKAFIAESDKYECFIHYFCERLLDQFRYYITPWDFLNNPDNKTLFVVPTAVYCNFNFSNGGLLRSENINISKSALPPKVYDKIHKYYTKLKVSFDTVLEEIRAEKDSLKKEDADIDKFIRVFTKKHENEKIGHVTKLTKILNDSPIIKAKLNDFLQFRKAGLFKRCMLSEKDSRVDPWEISDTDTKECQKQDKTDSWILYNVFEMFGSNYKIPKTELCNIFHIFSYTKDNPSKRMDAWFRNFAQSKVEITEEMNQALEQIINR